MRLFVTFLLIVLTATSAVFAQKPSPSDLPDLSRASPDVLRNLPPIHLLDKGESQPVLDAQHLAENVMVIQAKRKVGAQLTALDSSLRPFYHGVASGDPLSDRVILWTRVTPTVDAPVTVRWQLATDTSMSVIVTSGTFTTSQTRDYTVKVDAQGLEADKTYYYMFTALGANSLIGRTKTLPAPGATVRQVRFAVVSCSS